MGHINTYKEGVIMSKTVLHSLIDMLNEADTETIYNILVRFVPDVKPFDDEIEVIKQSEIDISKGDIVDLSSVEW